MSNDLERAADDVGLLQAMALTMPHDDYRRDQLLSIANKLVRGALAPAQPEGWVLVPVEPTWAMVEAAAQTPQSEFINGQLRTIQARTGKKMPELGSSWKTSAIAEAYRAMVKQAGEEFRTAPSQEGHAHGPAPSPPSSEEQKAAAQEAVSASAVAGIDGADRAHCADSSALCDERESQPVLNPAPAAPGEKFDIDPALLGQKYAGEKLETLIGESDPAPSTQERAGEVTAKDTAAQVPVSVSAGSESLSVETPVPAVPDTLPAGEPVHTDHPLRHWDRTCPACVAEGSPVEQMDIPAMLRGGGEPANTLPFTDAQVETLRDRLRRLLNAAGEWDTSNVDALCKQAQSATRLQAELAEARNNLADINTHVECAKRFDAEVKFLQDRAHDYCVRMEAAERRAGELREALSGLVGLIQLLKAGGHFAPDYDPMLNHRYITAVDSLREPS